jgi:hypothetical protein
LLEFERLGCGCLEAQGEVCDRKAKKMSEVFRGKKAHVGDQMYRDPEANPVLSDLEDVWVKEGFAHQREIYPLAEVVLGNLIEKAPCQCWVHQPVLPGHGRARTKPAIQIASVGEFEEDAFEGFRSQRHGLSLHARWETGLSGRIAWGWRAVEATGDLRERELPGR